MENLTSSLVELEFRHGVFYRLGAVYFALFVYWLALSWRTVSTTPSERPWLVGSGLAGFGYGLAAAFEWIGLALGTAFSIGFCFTLALLSADVAASFLASLLFLRPWELLENDSYVGMLPRLSFVLCLGHVLFGFARARRIEFIVGVQGALLIGFALWCFMTTFFAVDPGAAQSEYFDGFIKSIFLYFILVQVVKSRDSLRMLIGTLLLSFLFVGTICVFHTFYMASIADDADWRLKGFGAFTNSNDIGALMVLILPFALLGLIRKAESLPIRWISGVLSAVALVAIALSKSRGAILGIAAIIGTYFVVRMGKRAVVPLVGLFVVLAVPTILMVSNRGQDDLEGSSAGRKTYLKAGLRMGVKNPVFGVGFNAFPASLENYSSESLEESKQMTAHNSWVLVFAETGFIGLFLFSALFLRSMFSAWKIYDESPEFLLALVGYGVAMFFLSHSYLIYPYLLFALVEIASTLRRVERC